ncbi:uncharacterized protein isoform X2 [Rhodnius prolixus]|uniref:uncharacterized protein isoform X2 n=1 Tax=Rhodnius prolixus TaxID=13249 RepID=UPI003D188E81
MSESKLPKLRKKIKSQAREIIWRVNRFMKKESKKQGSNLFSKNSVQLTSIACGVSSETVEFIIKEKSLHKGFPTEKLQEEKKEKDWSSVVNYVGNCGPSMSTIQKVIEKTVDRVLCEDLPFKHNREADILRTVENYCPYCNFSTLSKFMFKKHLALHENKPHLVFSQDVSRNTHIESEADLKEKLYQCPKCSDLFRTDTALKYHKCVDTILSVGPSQLQESGISSNFDTVAEKYGVTALECALRFLNQKPIDLDLTKEQVVPVIDEDARYSVFNKDQYMTTLLDNKLCKLEEAVEELNRTVKAQNNFNVCTSSRYQKVKEQKPKQKHSSLMTNNDFSTTPTEVEEQKVKQKHSPLKTNNDFSTTPTEVKEQKIKQKHSPLKTNKNISISARNAVHAKYLRQILEEPTDIKADSSPLVEAFKQSCFSLTRKNKSGLTDLNSEHVIVEEKRKIENNIMCDRAYEDLERTMAMLTDKGSLTTGNNNMNSNNENQDKPRATNKDSSTAANSKIKSNGENKDKLMVTSIKNIKKRSSHCCKICDCVFNTHFSLKNHERDEHFPDYFLCRLCDYKSKIKIDLKKHYRKNHNKTYARVFFK